MSTDTTAIADPTRTADAPAASTPAPQPSGEPGSRAGESKVVLVVREGLPSNLAVNAAAVLGASIGTVHDLPRGSDATDASGTRFSGIVTTPVPVLTGSAEEITALFRKATATADATALALTEVARRARTYESYLADLAEAEQADADIVALIIAGPRNRVTKMTKRLPLLGAEAADAGEHR
jgi:hypothetical protein